MIKNNNVSFTDIVREGELSFSELDAVDQRTFLVPGSMLAIDLATSGGCGYVVAARRVIKTLNASGRQVALELLQSYQGGGNLGKTGMEKVQQVREYLEELLREV